LRARVLRIHQRERGEPEIGSAVERGADPPRHVDSIVDSVQRDDDPTWIVRIDRDAADANAVVLRHSLHADRVTREAAASVFRRVQGVAAGDEQRTARERGGVDGNADRARSPGRAAVLASQESALGAREDAPRIGGIEEHVAEEARPASVARGDHLVVVEEIELRERPAEPAVRSSEDAAPWLDRGDEQDAGIDGAREHALDLDVVVHRGEDAEAGVLELERQRRCAGSRRRCG